MEKDTMFIGLKESIVKMIKLPQSTGSIQPLSSYQWHFSQNQNKKNHNFYGNTKDPEKPKQS